MNSRGSNDPWNEAPVSPTLEGLAHAAAASPADTASGNPSRVDLSAGTTGGRATPGYLRGTPPGVDAGSALEQAKHHALAAYKRAWAEGEPYVHRYDLTQTTELLQQMNVPIPNLPPYDPAKDEKLPWEDEVRTAIEKLRAKKEARKSKAE